MQVRCKEHGGCMIHYEHDKLSKDRMNHHHVPVECVGIWSDSRLLGSFLSYELRSRNGARVTLTIAWFQVEFGLYFCASTNFRSDIFLVKEKDMIYM